MLLLSPAEPPAISETTTSITHLQLTVMFLCAWKGSAKAPVFPPEGVSLTSVYIRLLCLLLEHSDIIVEHLRYYWLALQHIVRDPGKQ